MSLIQVGTKAWQPYFTARLGYPNHREEIVAVLKIGSLRTKGCSEKNVFLKVGRL